MLYMVLEHFRDGRAREVYERFRAKGRMAPAGVEYVDSWVDTDIQRCWQLMRTDDVRLLHEWASHWSDLVDFEFIPVTTGREAAAKVLGS
jgi:hypothetical protein